MGISSFLSMRFKKDSSRHQKNGGWKAEIIWIVSMMYSLLKVFTFFPFPVLVRILSDGMFNLQRRTSDGYSRPLALIDTFSPHLGIGWILPVGDFSHCSRMGN